MIAIAMPGERGCRGHLHRGMAPSPAAPMRPARLSAGHGFARGRGATWALKVSGLRRCASTGAASVQRRLVEQRARRPTRIMRPRSPITRTPCPVDPRGRLFVGPPRVRARAHRPRVRRLRHWSPAAARCARVQRVRGAPCREGRDSFAPTAELSALVGDGERRRLAVIRGGPLLQGRTRRIKLCAGWRPPAVDRRAGASAASRRAESHLR